MFAFFYHNIFNYNGNTAWLLLYLAAVSLLFLTERNKLIRLLLIYIPAVMWIITALPPFQRAFNHFLDYQTFYRFFWCMPIYITIAYGGAKLCSDGGILHGMGEHEKTADADAGNAEKGRRIPLKTFLKNTGVLITAVLIIAAIAVSGRSVYQNDYIEPAKNPYHLPDSVVQVCDIILPENGDRVCAAFPVEMLMFVRSYSPLIMMPYGREVLVEEWYGRSELFDIMSNENIELEKMSELSKSYCCNYVIINDTKQLVGDPADYHFVLVSQIDGYNIYKDTSITWPN